MGAFVPQAGQPQTFDQIQAALVIGSPADLYHAADLLEQARHALDDLLAGLDRAWVELEEAWRDAGVAIAAGRDLSLRTRSLLHALDEADGGRLLRVAAAALSAGQARIHEIRAQRDAGAGAPVEHDQQAGMVLHGLAEAYRDVGVHLGGQQPPREIDANHTQLSRLARDDASRVTLAAGPGAETDEVFRPVSPTVTVARANEPVAPPAGGGGGGGGFPMMPMMPMGMGGGMGAMGGQTESTVQQRRAGAGAQGERGVWGDENGGWQVLGRRRPAAEPSVDRERLDSFLRELEQAPMTRETEKKPRGNGNG
ncbi:hypothetical protein [Micromonospora sp. KLBMP9576]|uniref:hypothetical protein n=1 Tax=Micromonospora sp. KLBMP9576 TaxID=3424769 RepID=UPI003D8F8707